MGNGLEFKRIWLRLGSLELAKVDRMMAVVAMAVGDELAQLRTRLSEGMLPEDVASEYAEDEIAVGHVMGQAAAVAYYTVIELQEKQALRLRVGLKKGGRASTYPQRASLFKMVTKKELSSLTEWKATDELRHIANAFKHNGNVSSSLAQYPMWVVNEPLGDVTERLGELRPLWESYLEQFAEALWEVGTV